MESHNCLAYTSDFHAVVLDSASTSAHPDAWLLTRISSLHKSHLRNNRVPHRAGNKVVRYRRPHAESLSQCSAYVAAARVHLRSWRWRSPDGAPAHRVLNPEDRSSPRRRKLPSGQYTPACLRKSPDAVKIATAVASLPRIGTSLPYSWCAETPSQDKAPSDWQTPEPHPLDDCRTGRPRFAYLEYKAPVRGKV